MEMMPQGHAGLSKLRAISDAAVSVGDHSAASTAGDWPISAAGFDGFHVANADRRGKDPFDMVKYGPVFATGRVVYPVSKRVFDLIGASIAIVLLSPLLVAVIACVSISGGSPFFRHRRVGQNGVFFDCLKFRTMVTESDGVLQNLLESDSTIKEEWLRYHKLKNDPRVTSIGRILRRSSLDELPQLWNVFRGEMSLVGPRPVEPDELRRYGRRVALFLSSRPGITGLWQISGRNNTDYRRRVALDVCYVRSRSVLLDANILMKTLPAVFTKSGAY
jgi:lipopolysaccharide/colanic/teichoic acid biosynthesis glycosyltransferase